uniref:C3H1-type domain-containing protein n=1 Tax=Neobodo designis TaxID=312471 RepID=A0A7S1PQ78_NEODS|eukprot:CAMPEP_0174841088 /NCGR_PEP_ID=MMETSP1114-20130205/9072_1 /TAXON_ID=312471 /ORGANISM="Neobodo designis, Strain CCAP 1951/1" /LENGTH=316 /DNA_ID=CAMNT_0016075259 /DNA_START=51 /DNA_END=1001 /DNA_ORIENTATION=-
MFANALSTVDALSVIDPCNRTGKITIPASFVTVTKGVSDYLKHGGNPPPDVKDLSLCLLYQKGRCNAGSRCNQVHAAPEFVSEIRARASSSKSCCAAHGDVHSSHLDHAKHVAVVKDGSVEVFPLTSFATTPSLETALSRARNGQARVQSSRLCRLHLKGSCKFGRDCKNIHLCPSATPERNAPQFDSAPPALGMAFRSVDITDRCTGPAGTGATAATSTTASAYIAYDCSAATRVDSDAHRLPTGASACDVTPLSVLSIMSEFNSMRGDAEADPLDIMDDDSSGSVGSAIDFGAFVDGLVRCGDVEPMASPQWIA